MLGVWRARPTEKRAARLPDYDQSYQQRERAENLHDASSWHLPTLTPKASVMRVTLEAPAMPTDRFCLERHTRWPTIRPIGARECPAAPSKGSHGGGLRHQHPGISGSRSLEIESKYRLTWTLPGQRSL